MDEHVRIYQLRRSVDRKNQPSRTAELDELHAAIQDLKPPRKHPYSLGLWDYAALSGCGAYRAVCLGGEGLIEGDYCYRLSSWPKLIAETPDYRPSTRVPPTLNEGEAFAFLEDEFLNSRKWLRLSKYVQGTYSGYRGHTWWTSEEMPTSKTMCAAHKLGLLNISIATEVIVLRCRVEYITGKSLFRVPSPVDAFFFDIFHASHENSSPTCGRAISVEDPSRLIAGGEEFVLKPLEIESAEIEFMPLRLDRQDIHRVRFYDVCAGLIAYYESLD